MDKPLTVDDFRDVAIPPEWGGMQHLCLIARFLTERFDADAKGKAAMPINEPRPPSSACEATMRSKSQSNRSTKNVTPVSRRQFLPVKDQSCGGRRLTEHFPASITVTDSPAAEKVMMINSKSPGKRIKLLTSASTSRQLSDKGDQICGGGGGHETHHQLPLNFQATIREMGGSDCRLVLEKTLSKSDARIDQARLSIPPGKIRPGSLDSEEKRLAATTQGTPVRFIDPSGKELKDMQLIFKRWKLTNNSNYVLNGEWNPVTRRNGLREGDIVRLWSFRVGTELGFALVNLRQQKKS